MGQSCAEIHTDTLFAADSQTQTVRAYPVGDNGREWSSPEIDAVTTGPVVDNSLVVVGTESGNVQVLERDSGENRWSATIAGPVGAIATSGRHVWVADRETGLSAYTRDDGTSVHRSTKPIDGSDIAVVDDVILFGDSRAYSIE